MTKTVKISIILILLNINCAMGQKIYVDKEFIGKNIREYYPEYLVKEANSSFKYIAKDSCEFYFYDKKIEGLGIKTENDTIQSIAIAITADFRDLVNQMSKKEGSPLTGISKTDIETPQTQDEGNLIFGRKRLYKPDYDEKQIENYSIIVWKSGNITTFLFVPCTFFNPENYLILEIDKTD